MNETCLAETFHVDLGTAQLFPDVVLVALALWRTTELSAILEHIRCERTSAHLVFCHLAIEYMQ